MAKAESQANERYAELEQTSIKDTKNLEDQLQTLSAELKATKTTNQSLTSSLKESEDSVHRARDESNELNQTQLENNERLQAIINSKDEEIISKDEEINRLKSSSSSTKQSIRDAGVGTSTSLISRIAPTAPNEASTTESNETLDATAILSGVLHQRAIPHEEDEPGDTTIALGAGANQLRNEREALLDTLAEGEQTIAISDSDLPIESENRITEVNRDITNTDLDETINLGRDGGDNGKIN